MAKRAFSPKEIANIKIKELPLEGKWEEAFGRPSFYETWFISGQSASGKSSFVMQLSKMLCGFGSVLYLSLEEGVGKSFQDRLKRFHMDEVQGRFRVILEESRDELIARLKKPKSAMFVVVDSFQMAHWEYDDTEKLIKEFPKKCFIFISQEDKGRPLGKAAVRLKYYAGVKIRTIGFKAYCQGRFVNGSDSYYTVWEEGAMRVYNAI